MREDGGSPRGSFWYQSPFRSNLEGFTCHWGWMPVNFVTWPVTGLLDWPLLVRALAATLAVIPVYIGWFAWVVWGRDAFPLPDRDQEPSQCS